MKDSQKLLATLYVTAVTTCVISPLWLFWANQEIGLFCLWLFATLLFVCLVIKKSFRRLNPGEMILVSCLGHIYRLDSSTGTNTSGVFGTGLVLLFPPGMVRGQIFPTGGFEISLQSNSGNTLPSANIPSITPVRVFLHIMARLKQEAQTLKILVETVPGTGDHLNFTHLEKMDFFVGGDDTVVPTIEKRDSMCLAKFLLNLIQNTIDEAVGQAIGDCTLEDALRNKETIERVIRERIEVGTTIFGQTKLLSAFQVFDINIIAIVPSNKATAEALSSETKETLLAKGAIAQATGKAKAIKLVAQELISPSGQMALAAETIGKLPSGVTLISGTNVMETAASLVSANFAGQQPNRNPPSTTPRGP